MEGYRNGDQTVREVGEPGETRSSQREHVRQKGRATDIACFREMEEDER